MTRLVLFEQPPFFTLRATMQTGCVSLPSYLLPHSSNPTPLTVVLAQLIFTRPSLGIDASAFLGEDADLVGSLVDYLMDIVGIAGPILAFGIISVLSCCFWSCT